MSHRRKIKERSTDPQVKCKAVHFDTEPEAEAMQLIFKQQGKRTTRGWSNRCRSWHVYTIN